MSTVLLRLLGPQDAPAYRSLRLRGLATHPQAFTSSAAEEAERPLAWSQQRLRPDPARPHDAFLGAFAGSELVGIVGLQGRYRPKEAHNATVVGMYVAPEHSGRGVGLALMQALLAHAAQCPGLVQLDLTVTEGNLAAERLYQRCGFVAWGTQPRAVRVDARYLAKIHMGLALR